MCNVPILNSNGKLDTTILPSLAITDTFTANSQAAMLALSAEKGDVCVRTDESKTYILQSEPASTFVNWIELATPTDLVQSVQSHSQIVIKITPMLRCFFMIMGFAIALSSALREVKCS